MNQESCSFFVWEFISLAPFPVNLGWNMKGGSEAMIRSGKWVLFDFALEGVCVKLREAILFLCSLSNPTFLAWFCNGVWSSGLDFCEETQNKHSVCNEGIF
ncbi:hypothetical protein Csa_012037, partial [Cucumis sativus]